MNRLLLLLYVLTAAVSALASTSVEGVPSRALFLVAACGFSVLSVLAVVRR